MLQYIIEIKDAGSGNATVECKPVVDNPTKAEIAVASEVKQRIDSVLERLAEPPAPKKFQKTY